jgi:hypothetical protein
LVDSEGGVLGILRRLSDARESGAIEPPDDTHTRSRYPLLWGVLTWSVLPDGSPRACAEVKITLTDRCWLVTLSDHQSERRTSVQVERLSDAFGHLERLLGSGKATWRAFKSYQRISDDEVKKAKQRRRKKNDDAAG